MSHIKQSPEQIVDKWSSFINQPDTELSMILKAVSDSCMKLTLFGTIFTWRPNKFYHTLTQSIVSDVLKGFLYKDDGVWEWYDSRKAPQNLPEEDISIFLCRNAREPPKCPKCGEYVGGVDNEVWINE